MATDYAAKLEHLAEVASKPGCTIWLCMVIPQLRGGAREIRRLRKELGLTDEPETDTVDEDQLGLFEQE